MTTLQSLLFVIFVPAGLTAAPKAIQEGGGGCGERPRAVCLCMAGVSIWVRDVTLKLRREYNV